LNLTQPLVRCGGSAKTQVARSAFAFPHKSKSASRKKQNGAAVTRLDRRFPYLSVD